MTFRGIPLDAITFYEGLVEDNSREYWLAHKEVYEQAVAQPLTALCAALADELGEADLFRPYRDTRFSKNKAPYKVYQGAIVPTDGACGFYVEVSAKGLRTGGGYHVHSPDQVQRYREAVDDEESGEELASIVATLDRRGLALSGEALKTQPRGFAPDHPRVALLRQRDVVVERLHGAPKWLHTAKALDRVRADWDAVRPLNDWLGAHVGPSTADTARWRR